MAENKSIDVISSIAITPDLITMVTERIETEGLSVFAARSLAEEIIYSLKAFGENQDRIPILKAHIP